MFCTLYLTVIEMILLKKCIYSIHIAEMSILLGFSDSLGNQKEQFVFALTESQEDKSWNLVNVQKYSYDL